MPLTVYQNSFISILLLASASSQREKLERRVKTTATLLVETGSLKIFTQVAEPTKLFATLEVGSGIFSVSICTCSSHSLKVREVSQQICRHLCILSTTGTLCPDKAVLYFDRTSTDVLTVDVKARMASSNEDTTTFISARK